MDLSKAEKTLKNLEESSSKIEQISSAVADLRAHQGELEALPGNVKKPIEKAIKDFSRIQEELKSLPEAVKKESSAIEANLRSKIVELENSMLKKLDQVEEGISTTIKSEIKGARDESSKQLVALKDDLKEAQSENAKQLTALKDDLSKFIDEKLRATNRNTTFVIVLGLAILGVLCWYVFTKSNLV